MTWTGRIKLACLTFRRVAFPLYGWTFIFIGVSIVLLFTAVIEGINRVPWASLLNSGGSIAPSMPDSSAMPFLGFLEPGQGQLDQYSSMLSDPSSLLPIVGTLGGIFSLISIVGIVIGSLFWAGQFNLAAKAYREKVSFGDFRFSGFLRILGWQLILSLIYLVLTVLSVLVYFALADTTIALWIFFIIYGLVFIGIQIYTLPWLAISMYYILAHREQGFIVAVKGSWQFFQRHMGALWGYLGTVLLIYTAFLLLIKISTGLQFIASLVVSPFIMILAIVWVLSLDDNDREIAVDSQLNPTPYPTTSYPETAATIEDTLVPVSQVDTTGLKCEKTKISLQKEEALPPLPEDKP